MSPGKSRIFFPTIHWIVNLDKMKNKTEISPSVIAWETTRRCPLNCRHCRGGAMDREYRGELSRAEAEAMLRSISSICAPVLILTGGEPMSRPDIYDLAKFADSLGMRVVMAPCGPMLNSKSVRKIISSGIKAISISLDGADAKTHDSFRGTEGAFDSALNAIRCAREAGLPFQINTTVSKINADQLPDMLDLAVREGAETLDLFFLVPTGRGKTLETLALSPRESEKVLNWICEVSAAAPIHLKTTCAPQLARAMHENKVQIPLRLSPGCMAGNKFVFISHTGILQPCGFLEIDCGDLREYNMDFAKAYRDSEVFRKLRDPDGYLGKCGICEFRVTCGGCRARAYAFSGNFLGPAPDCRYIPKT